MSSGAFGVVTLTGARGDDTVVVIAAPARPIAPGTTRTTTPVRARVAAEPAQPVVRVVPVALVVPPPAGCTGVVAEIRWPSGWRVVCSGPRSGLLGSTDPSGVTTLFVRPGETTTWLRVVALHESGHAWDLAGLDATDISLWCAVRGCDAPRFFTSGVSADQPGGAEDWAASWDACHGGEYHRSYLGLPAPTATQCALQDTLVTYPG